MLALATCYCNDLYREAARLGIGLERVEVEASAEFAGIGLAASHVRYRASIESPAGPDAIARLIRETDAVAEVHNTLRQGVAVELTDGPVGAAPTSASGRSSSIAVEPIGYVTAARGTPEDDEWGGSESTITLIASIDESALDGIESFSHVEVIFQFHAVPPEKIVSSARHPRNNPEWPKAGIFAQRGKNRPNRLGSTICKVVRRAGRMLTVAELDAIDGTPVLDIKPVIREFLPREATHQPAWASELMSAYWRTPGR